jgi:hypothetical protein
MLAPFLDGEDMIEYQETVYPRSNLKRHKANDLEEMRTR